MIEDDEDDYLLTRDLFQEIAPEGYELEWVRTFEDALDETKSECFDVCLLDYRLGQHDGLELMAKLRGLGYKCPMILLTGQGDREIDDMAMRAGAADYLIKSQLNAPYLERSIRYAVQQRQFSEERIQFVREQEARVQAEAANQAKDDFLAVLSHELRTPLNAMLGWARLLRSIRDNDEVFEKAVDAIERSAVIQTKFVDDLMDVTRIVNGSLRLTRIPVPISKVVEPAIQSIRPTAAAKTIELITEIPEDAGFVLADPDRLQQVINNLLSNAVKFTPQDGKIFVTLVQTDDEVRLSIRDTGEGIDAEFLPNVFERYRQAHNATTNRKGGLGLGLAIVKSLVEMHDGKVWAESPGIGGGTTFTISLPSVSESAAAT
jgi:Osmosensitive K+ channel histidine kinase